MDHSKELSAHLAAQHADVTLQSVLTNCPNFYWNGHIILQVPQVRM